jgi:amidase
MLRLGAVVVDPADIPTAADLMEGTAELEVLLYEFKAGINEYLASRPDLPVRTLEDLIAFNEENRDTVMPYFGQELFEQAQAKGDLNEDAYKKALDESRRLGREGIDSVMDEFRLDAVVMPTNGPPFGIDLVNGDGQVMGSSAPAATAGYPAITVPVGYSFGLPVGLSFVGRAYSEPTLLRLAYAYEQATLHRQPPQFLPTAPTDAATTSAATPAPLPVTGGMALTRRGTIRPV